MKKILKTVVLKLLRKKAQRVIASDAKVIAVTGSMGKTTTKEAIAHVLRKKYRVLAASEGFNTEVGVLLTLVDEHTSGFSSVRQWLRILWRVFWKKIAIPDIIVLEFGVDKPGDMDVLLKIIKPDYAVLTNIAPVHLGNGQFRSIEEIATEKGKLITALPASGTAILNVDNEYIRRVTSQTSARIISYAVKEHAEFQVHRVEQRADGISFDISSRNENAALFVRFFGTYHWTVLVPALLIAVEFGIPLLEAEEELRSFLPPAGRGRIFVGKNDSILWDSSYNSSPEATKAALRAMRSIPAKRRLTLLGNMNELGVDSEKFHEELGRVAAAEVSEIFFVGKESEAFQMGVNKQKPLHVFPDAASAGDYLETVLEEGDLLLVKGSQNGVFLERAVKKLLAHPEDVQLLCRQSDVWLRK